MSDSLSFVFSAFAVDASVPRVPLGNAGGFSGARLWRVDVGAERLCLRCWPEAQDATRVRFVHGVQEFAAMQLDFVPRLRRTSSGDTIVAHGGRLWELANWMPGQADYHRDPRPERLPAALAALARLHLAWEYFPTRMTGLAPSPGIAERAQRLEVFRGLVPALEQGLPPADAELALRGRPILDSFRCHVDTVAAQLRRATQITVPLQPVLRDVWHDHLLFTGDCVTGIVDYGAVRVDTVAADIARLTGSLVRNDEAGWQAALAAYAAVRPLSEDERSLIGAFDASSVLMTGMNWLVWLLLESRRFDDRSAVLHRLDEAVVRLTSLSTATLPEWG